MCQVGTPLRRLAQQREDEHQERASGWELAVSAALDEAELTTAIRELTEPVPALGRRSAPMAVSQLVGWAVTCHVAHPQGTLDTTLRHALRATADVDGRPAGHVMSRNDQRRPDDALPEPPAPTRASAPLRERVARLLPAIDHDLPTPTIEEEHQ